MTVHRKSESQSRESAACYCRAKFCRYPRARSWPPQRGQRRSGRRARRSARGRPSLWQRSSAPGLRSCRTRASQSCPSLPCESRMMSGPRLRRLPQLTCRPRLSPELRSSPWALAYGRPARRAACAAYRAFVDDRARASSHVPPHRLTVRKDADRARLVLWRKAYHAAAFAQRQATVLQAIAQVAVLVLLRPQLAILFANQVIAAGHSDDQRATKRRNNQPVDAARVVVQREGDGFEAGRYIVCLHGRRRHRHAVEPEDVIRALLGRLAFVAALRIADASEFAAGIILLQKPLDLGSKDRRALVETQHFVLHVDASVDFLSEQRGRKHAAEVEPHHHVMPRHRPQRIAR